MSNPVREAVLSDSPKYFFHNEENIFAKNALSWWHATFPKTVTLYIRCLAPEAFRNTAAYVALGKQL